MFARTHDKESVKEQRRFFRARKAENEYSRKLRAIAKQVGELATAYGPTRAAELDAALARYADAIDPWARAAAERMLGDVARRDEAAWAEMSKDMSRRLREEVRTAPTGDLMRALMAEQVTLIKSLPLDAAKRVHEWVLKGQENAVRADEVAKQVYATGHVSKGRAMLIARTEVARAASTLLQGRAEHVGSEGYIWRTAEDEDVRKSHRKMAGKFVRWDDPPTLDKLVGHAGQLPNCFPGSTKASLTHGCHWLWRRRYEGSVISIKTQTGATVELTPNHPVLTLRGWVAAKDIDATDHVIQDVRDHLLALEDDKDQGQPTFNDIFAALDIIGRRERKPGLLFNFHGETTEDDVDAIRADHLLPGYRVSETFERISNFALSRADRGIIDRVIEGSASHVRKAYSASFFDKVLTVAAAEGAHPVNVGLAAIAPLDAIALENVGHDQSRASIAQRKREFAFSGLVRGYDLALRKVCSSVQSRRHAVADDHAASTQSLADVVGIDADGRAGILQRGAGLYQALRVVDKSIRDFSGHVFTMQTADGWFSVTTGAVIVKNCRCYPEPVVPDEP